MGVYIKGMGIPENCIECPMQFGGMCYVMPADVDESRVAPTVEAAQKQGKPTWCPLTEIPEPHGRLIDAEKLKKEYPHDTDWNYPVNTNCYVCESIDNAPTVIKAEGGESHDY